MTLIDVRFKWNDKEGTCSDCGLPAAFAVPDAYGPNPSGTIAPHMKRCSVCAANDAVEGERLVRIYKLD